MAILEAHALNINVGIKTENRKNTSVLVHNFIVEVRMKVNLLSMVVVDISVNINRVFVNIKVAKVVLVVHPNTPRILN